MKASLNLRGPSRKAKYSLATDSAPVARAKGGKNPDKGRIVNLKPHAYKRSEPVYSGQDSATGLVCVKYQTTSTKAQTKLKAQTVKSNRKVWSLLVWDRDLFGI